MRSLRSAWRGNTREIIYGYLPICVVLWTGAGPAGLTGDGRLALWAVWLSSDDGSSIR